jgi:hypothetical protein
LYGFSNNPGSAVQIENKETIMSFFANRIFNIAGTATFLCATAVSASAQQGNFHLPFEAKWAGVECPAGDYQVALPERYNGKSTFLVRGPAGTSFILPMSEDTYGNHAGNPAGTYLQLVKVDGGWFVKKYEAGSRSLVFYFKTPKPSHRVQIASQDSARIRVSGD